MRKKKKVTQKKNPRNRSRRSEGETLREELLKLTTDLLKKKSANEISLRELARIAGVSEAAPYRHFKDKESLLAAVAESGFEYLRALLEEVLKEAKDPEEQFYLAGQKYLEMGLRHPETLKLMFGPFIVNPQNHMNLFLAGKRAFLALVAVVSRGQEKGLIGEGDRLHRALHCWMAVHGFTMLVVDRRCEWLGLNQENAAQAMHSFSADLLSGMRSNLKTTKFKLHIEGLPLELLVKAGLPFV